MLIAKALKLWVKVIFEAGEGVKHFSQHHERRAHGDEISFQDQEGLW